MNHSLLDRIEPVTRRFRARQWWWIVTSIAIVLAIIAFTLIDYARAEKIDGFVAAAVFGGMAGWGCFVAWIIGFRTYRDPRQIAAKIETKFPDLNQRLLTALSQSESKEAKPLGYLQGQVIREARDHSRDNAWTDTLPNSQLWISRLCGLGSIAALLSMIGSLAFAKPSADQFRLMSRSDPSSIQVTVEPGNTEIERGTSLTITAKFGSKIPKDTQLICTSVDAKGEEIVRRLNMTQTLSDPIVGSFLASVDQKFTYQIVANQWSSEKFTIDVFDFPALVRSDADLDYPEYTGLEDKLIEDTVRVSAVEGTRVKWLCFLNKPVSSGELVDKDGHRIALKPDPIVPGALSTQFDLTETRQLTLELVDDAGRKNKYPPELIARLLPNQPPKLKLTNAKDTSVSPLEELPVGVEVQDDFGIAKVGLTYTFADEPPKDIVLKEKLGRGGKEKMQHLIALEELNAQPDQLLAYHFWADDQGPGGEIRRTQSDMFFAEVRPFEEIYREGEPPAGGEQQQQQSQNGQKAEELAELQKQIINATWTVIREEKNSKPSKKFAENAGLLKTSQIDALSQLNELAAELEDPESQSHAEAAREKMESAIAALTKALDEKRTSHLHPALAAEQAAYGGLLKLRAREFQVVRQQQRQQQQGQQSQSQQRRQQQLDELEIKEEENRYEAQQQAQSKEEQQQREVRQVLNRLRELAKRQEDLNKQIAELQSALEQAETEQDKEEIERQLKRLRDQQQDLLRETDELSERMQSPENADEMAEANEQLEQTRENVQKSAQALENKDASEALAAGKRAEREFEDMRDEFRKKAAGEFNQTVREMRTRAQELEEQQEKIAEKMRETTAEDSAPGLRSPSDQVGVKENLEQQRKRLGELLEQMQETVDEAETTEPLLAEKLYDSYRKAQQLQIDRHLQDTTELLRRGFDAEAQEFQQPAQQGIRELREEIESAALSVLGDKTEGLRRALSEMEQLSKDLENEIDQADPNARRTGSDQLATDQKSQQERETSSEGKPLGQEPPSQPSQDQQGQLAREGQPSNIHQTGAPASGGLSRFAADNPSSRPIAGDGFRDWSDRLRDVEEMVENPELRSRAARIRDRARNVRVELKRNSQEPQWELVDEMIAKPLRELKRDVQEELIRRSADKNALVPIDRDPVPDEFTDAVQRYYENIGSGS